MTSYERPYRVGNHSPVNVWFEPQAGREYSVQICMATSPVNAALIVDALNQRSGIFQLCVDYEKLRAELAAVKAKAGMKWQWMTAPISDMQHLIAAGWDGSRVESSFCGERTTTWWQTPKADDQFCASCAFGDSRRPDTEATEQAPRCGEAGHHREFCDEPVPDGFCSEHGEVGASVARAHEPLKANTLVLPSNWRDQIASDMVPGGEESLYERITGRINAWRHGGEYVSQHDTLECRDPASTPAQEVARCSAHGASTCPTCTLNPADCGDLDAVVCGCGTYSVDGMHWDTCPNRVVSITNDGSWKLTTGDTVDPTAGDPVW